MDSTIPRKRLADILIAIEAMEKKYAAALLQRLSCRRRQPASADPVRRQRPRPAAPLPSCSAPTSWRPACAWAAPSPASTAWAWKSSTRCACSFQPAEREQMFAVKRAFDPQELLNPGKVVPTLHRCAEYGKMHRQARPAAICRLPRF
jgi:glycolate oxidase